MMEFKLIVVHFSGDNKVHKVLENIFLRALFFMICAFCPMTTISHAQGDICFTETKIGNLSFPFYKSKLSLKDGKFDKDDGFYAFLYSVTIGEHLKDGSQIAAAVIEMDMTGGSGREKILYILKCKKNAISISQEFPLGDRVKLNSLSFNGDVLSVSGLFHGPEDGQCCPSLNITFYYKLINGKIVDIKNEYKEVGGRWSRVKNISGEKNQQPPKKLKQEKMNTSGQNQSTGFDQMTENLKSMLKNNKIMPNWKKFLTNEIFINYVDDASLVAINDRQIKFCQQWVYNELGSSMMTQKFGTNEPIKYDVNCSTIDCSTRRFRDDVDEFRSESGRLLRKNQTGRWIDIVAGSPMEKFSEIACAKLIPQNNTKGTSSQRKISNSSYHVGVINWTIIEQISRKLLPYHAQLPPGYAANPSNQDLKIIKYLAITIMKAAEIYARQNDFDIIVVQNKFTGHMSHGTPLIRDELPYFDPSKVNEFLKIINGPSGIDYAKSLNPTNLDREIASVVDSMN